MQYVLDDKEYAALVSKQNAYTTKIKEQFISFVDLVIGEGELRCIYQPSHSTLYTYYCDECPLQDVCPKDQEYSQ